MAMAVTLADSEVKDMQSAVTLVALMLDMDLLVVSAKALAAMTMALEATVLSEELVAPLADKVSN